jgi:hypothetical protein
LDNDRKWNDITNVPPPVGKDVEIKGMMFGKERISTAMWTGKLGFWWTSFKGKITHWRYKEERSQ